MSDTATPHAQGTAIAGQAPAGDAPDASNGGSPAVTTTPTETSTTQPTEKDYRHAQQKITKEIEKKMAIGRKMVERDADNIFDIAATDPDLAKKLLSEYVDYEGMTIDDVLAGKKPGTVTTTGGQPNVTAQRLSKIEEQLLSERVLRMKEKHPDLQGDVEEKFRELYSDEKFAEEEPEKVLNAARSLVGKPLPTASNASDVAAELLTQQEGAQTSFRGGAQPRKAESPESAAMRAAFGHSQEDLDKLLPKAAPWLTLG